ncbi:MAG: sulfatase-like hydrolase/transferase, partial [Wenzhouxiangellaceae bacterium]|nr:sulfatase-like hydrolase/transferase [Wenzhouxiangellaceae bacterium]
LSLGAMNFLSGLDRGFDHASDRSEDDRAFRRDDAETLEMALDWLADQDGETPLFLLLHLYDVHSPHLPTPASRAAMGDYSGELADGISVETLYNDSQKFVDRPDDLEALRWLYSGEAAEADDRAGRFLAALDAAGILDDSVVVFLADHGQGLGENAYFGHGPTLEQTVLHVPLIVRDFRAPPDGRRVTDNAGLVDVAPTLLALAGLPHDDLPGRDLLAGEPPREPPAYLSEVEQRSGQTEYRPEWFDDEALAVFFDDFKLVDAEGEQRLYRLTGDRGDVLEPAADDALHPALRAWLVDLMAAYRDGTLDSERADLDAEAVEQLRSLGYIQ